MFRRTRLRPGFSSGDQRQAPAGNKYHGTGAPRSVYLDFYLREMYEKHFSELFSHAVFGYTLRVAAFSSFCWISFLTGKRLLLWSEEGKPLSQRHFQRYVPVTFIDRTPEGGKDSEIFIYRFALPNSFDYTGHQCFSSCEINLRNAIIRPIKRYYTPINHPEQRGIVEFAIKHYMPGEMSTVLRTMEPGETVHVGGWLSEMKYVPNKYDEIGFIAANSGITPFLQLLTCALGNPEDKTKFSLLFANETPEAIPFLGKLKAVQERFPERVNINFVVTRLGPTGKSGGGEEVKLKRASEGLLELGKPLSLQNQSSSSATTSLTSANKNDVMVYDDSLKDIKCTAIKADPIKTSNDLNYNGYQGFVNRDLILETMPWPNEKNSKVLVCGPAKFMSNICGRSTPVSRITYIQGVYDGILRNMGYSRNSIYKFSYTWHYIGYDT